MQRVSDNEFAESLGLDGHAAYLACAIRRTVARTCKMEACHLDSAYDTRVIYRNVRYFDGWDDLNFILELENTLKQHVRLSPTDLPPIIERRDGILSLYGKLIPGPAGFGQWVKAMVSVLQGQERDMNVMFGEDLMSPPPEA